MNCGNLSVFEIRSRLLPHVVPSPEALLNNGITVEELTDPALPSHYEMVRAVKAKLEEWSPAVFVGHNSMRFGEHLLRQAFYQTLHPPFLTNTNGNGRLDSLSVLRATHFLEPGVLTVPTGDKGRPSFSLQRLALANGITHDAIGNGEATLHLCRLMAGGAWVHWSNFVRFARKVSVLDFVEGNEVFAYVDIADGRAGVHMVAAIGINPENKSDVFVFDLTHDPAGLAPRPDRDLDELLLAEPSQVRCLRANASPCILPYEDLPDRIRAAAPSIAELMRRAACLRGEGDLTQRLIAAMSRNREREPSNYVEEQIYDRFPSSEDQEIMAEFHEAMWSERPDLLGQLMDTRSRILGERLLYNDAPKVMPEQGLSRRRTEIAACLTIEEAPVPWLTLPKAIRRADDLLIGLTGGKALLLRDLRDYLHRRVKEARAMTDLQ